MEHRDLYYKTLFLKSGKLVFKTYLWVTLIIIGVELLLFPIFMISHLNKIEICTPYIISLDEDHFTSVWNNEYRLPIETDTLLVEFHHYNNRSFLSMQLSQVSNIRTTRIDSVYRLLKNDFPDSEFSIEISASLFQVFMEAFFDNSTNDYVFKFTFARLFAVHVYYVISHFLYGRPYYAIPLLFVVYFLIYRTKLIRRRFLKRVSHCLKGKC